MPNPSTAVMNDPLSYDPFGNLKIDKAELDEKMNQAAYRSNIKHSLVHRVSPPVCEIKGSILKEGLAKEFAKDRQTEVGDPRFKKLLEEAWALHQAKSIDYGSDEDPLANLRGVEEMGLHPISGILIRLRDKMHRANRWYKKKTLANEGIRDTFLDIAGYAYLAIIMLDEESEKNSSGGLTVSDK